MALTTAIVLLGLVLEDQNLLALAVLHHVSGDGSALHNGSAESGVVAIQNSQNLVEGDGVAGFDIQLLDVEGIALGHLILLAAGHDDCVHTLHLPFLYYGLAVGGEGRALLLVTPRLLATRGFPSPRTQTKALRLLGFRPRFGPSSLLATARTLLSHSKRL